MEDALDLALTWVTSTWVTRGSSALYHNLPAINQSKKEKDRQTDRQTDRQIIESSFIDVTGFEQLSGHVSESNGRSWRVGSDDSSGFLLQLAIWVTY